MTSRRELLKFAGLSLIGAGIIRCAKAGAPHQNKMLGQQTFDRIVEKSRLLNWQTKQIGELMGLVGLELQNIPYVAYTLEVDPDHERCVINLQGLDCVTFFESCLGMARMIILGGSTPEDFRKQVELTRYRGGIVNGYPSRLHYTTDWFYDNARKGTISIVSDLIPGNRAFDQKVGYMSANPSSYRQLHLHPELIPAIAATEREINARPKRFIPMDDVAAAESYLQTGDIIGVATTQPGIDIAHTGLAFKDAAGVVHFFDASSAKSKMKVTLEGRLSDSIKWSTHNTGIIVARPLPPVSTN